MTASAEIRVFVPNNSHSEPIGLYMVADYHEYPQPVSIDFTSPRNGRDLISVITNHYHSLHVQDKDMHVDLYTDEDGSKEKMGESIDKLIYFQQKMEILSVELLGVLNWGKLKVPLVEVEAKPFTLGVGFLICPENECYLTMPGRNESFNKFFAGVRGRYAKNWRIISGDELEKFKQIKSSYPSYSIIPTNSKHRPSSSNVQYPTVYLNLKEYDQRLKIPLNSDPFSLDTDTYPEVKPVIEWLSLIKTLDKNQTIDSDRIKTLLTREISHEDIETIRQTMFRLENDKYRNGYIQFSRYASTLRQWSAVTPVGYLQDGDLKYVYFYPETNFWPTNEDTGEAIIQIMPVRQTEQGYRIDLDAIPYTPKGPILVAEAIQLATYSLPIEFRINLVEDGTFDQGIGSWHVDDSATWAPTEGITDSGALRMAAPYYSRPPYIHEKHATRCLPIGKAIEFTVEAWFRYDKLPVEGSGHRLYLYWHRSEDCSQQGEYDGFIQPEVAEGWQKLEKSAIKSKLHAKALEIRLTQNQESSAREPEQDPHWSDSIREFFGLQPLLETATAYWDNVSLNATGFQETPFSTSISGSEHTLPPGQNYVKNGDFNLNADGWRLWKDLKVWVPDGGYRQTGALRSTLVSTQNPTGSPMFFKCIAFGDYRSYEISVRYRRDPNSTQDGDARLRALWFENEDCTGRAGTLYQDARSVPGFEWQQLKISNLEPVPGSRALRITLLQTISGAGEFSVFWDDVYLGASTAE